jgi:hypothetical protein
MMTIITACFLKLLLRFLSFLLLDSGWVLLVLQDGAVFFTPVCFHHHTGAYGFLLPYCFFWFILSSPFLL